MIDPNPLTTQPGIDDQPATPSPVASQPTTPTVPTTLATPTVAALSEVVASSLPRRLAGAVLDFGCYFGLCILVGIKGWVAPAATASPGIALAVFAAAVYAFVFIVTKSAVALPFSQLAGKIPVIGKGLYTTAEESLTGKEEGLLSCPLCTGMWVGSLLAGLGVVAFPLGTGLAAARGLAVHGLLGAGFAFFLHVVIDKLQKED